MYHSQSTRTGAVIAALSACVFFAGTTANAPAAGSTEITALVASNAQKAFTELIADFEKTHPGVTVNAQYLGGSKIGTMLDGGTPADVVLVGSTVIDKYSTSVESPTPVLRNKDIIIVPKGNPDKITGLKDLANSGVKLSLGTPSSAVGTISSQIIQNAAQGGLGFDFVQKVRGNTVVQSDKGSDVVAAVADGKANAAIVFQSDGDASKFQIIPIDDKDNVVSTYAMTVAKTAKHADLGKAFVAMVAGSQGQAVLHKYHYMSPK